MSNEVKTKSKRNKTLVSRITSIFVKAEESADGMPAVKPCEVSPERQTEILNAYKQFCDEHKDEEIQQGPMKYRAPDFREGAK